MCSELFLLIFYFLVLFCVNYFLWILLKSGFQQFFFLVKIKKITSLFSDLNSIIFFYFYNKAEFAKENLIFQFKNKLKFKDILVLGNYYKLLNEKKRKEENYFFNLLQFQYLSLKLNKD